MTTSTGPAPARHQLVLVTGASTGIGAATARELAGRGYHVLAGVRRATDGDALRSDRIEPVLLDITDQAQVDAVAERVSSDQPHRPLRAVVNNAGISVNAPFEVLSMATWRQQFEVNLFGHVAVLQALLPALIQSRGTVVNVSSVGGKVALPTYGAYAAAKFALEGASDALRREMKPFGFNVVVIEPGRCRPRSFAAGPSRRRRPPPPWTPLSSSATAAS